MSINKSDLAKIKHILAIDYGKSKVGLAFSEKETRMAFPLDIIMMDENFLEELSKIIRKKEIDLVVLGKPKWIEEKKDWKYEKLIDFLKNEIEIKIDFAEEMFTSKMAQENLKQAGKKNISKDDSEAARIILQDWLDKIVTSD